MTKQQLIQQKIAVDRRIGELRATLAECCELEQHKLYWTRDRLKRGLRDELTQLRMDSQRLQAEIGAAKAADPDHINHWFRQAAFELLPMEKFQELGRHARVLQQLHLQQQDASEQSGT